MKTLASGLVTRRRRLQANVVAMATAASVAALSRCCCHCLGSCAALETPRPWQPVHMYDDLSWCRSSTETEATCMSQRHAWDHCWLMYVVIALHFAYTCTMLAMQGVKQSPKPMAAPHHATGCCYCRPAAHMQVMSNMTSMLVIPYTADT